MDQVTITGYVPGALGRITELHGTYYSKNWNLDLYFEAKVATELAEFLNRLDPERDGAWFAQVDEKVVGGIFIDGTKTGNRQARLRWFILDPAYQGYGLGNRLMNAAMEFCHQKQFHSVYLTTFAGLVAACHLYEKHGFKVTGEKDGTHLTGNSDLRELIYELFLDEIREER